MNKFAQHIFVIPEDEADEEIANGFAMHERVDLRRIQVMPVARGWNNVLTTFQEEYIPRLRKYPLGHVVMLIDFDGQGGGRMADVQRVIPDDLRDRVFVVGSSNNPEKLKAALNLSLERIGWQLAQDCAALGGSGLWDHEHLQHNAEERQRLATVVQAFLFS
jgi:hypothetical protein